MNITLEFEVTYIPSMNRVRVSLIRRNEGNYSDLMGTAYLWASPSWHSISDIEVKILKASAKLFREYQRNKHFTLAISAVCLSASEKISLIQDKKTIDLINEFKRRIPDGSVMSRVAARDVGNIIEKLFGKKAKVLNLPSRKEH